MPHEDNLLDDYAQSNALRNVSPRLKLLFGFGAMLLCIASATPVAPLFVAVTMSFITVGLAKIPMRFYSKLLLIPLSFAFLSAVVVAFMHGGDDQLLAFTVLGWNLSIYDDGADLALLVIARTFGSMCSLFFMALTTPMIEIFSVFKSLGLPDFLVEVSMMMYRYIFVFLDEAAMIHDAQVMRLGDAGFKKTLNSLTLLTSVLFIRAWEQGERLIVAMNSRCYDGKLNLMDQSSKAGPKGTLAVMGFLAVVAVIAVLTRGIQIF